MAVTIEKENDTELLLKIDNGDYKKMRQILQSWNFKDEQAFLRFAVSLLLETEDKELWIKENGMTIPVAPAKHSIKE